MLEKGHLIGAPVTGLRAGINDGASHAVDSSDIAFQLAARGAFREAYPQAGPIILEPIMKVQCEGPAEFHGPIVSTLMGRRGVIIGSTEEEGFTQIDAEVPLSEMFGYSTALRSATQGKAEFTMEFAKYSRVPDAIAKELVAKYQDEQEKKKK
jgi:elongation factor G